MGMNLTDSKREVEIEIIERWGEGKLCPAPETEFQLLSVK
jgi:hypothetical protein